MSLDGLIGNEDFTSKLSIDNFELLQMTFTTGNRCLRSKSVKLLWINPQIYIETPWHFGKAKTSASLLSQRKWKQAMQEFYTYREELILTFKKQRFFRTDISPKRLVGYPCQFGKAKTFASSVNENKDMQWENCTYTAMVWRKYRTSFSRSNLFPLYSTLMTLKLMFLWMRWRCIKRL